MSGTLLEHEAKTLLRTYDLPVLDFIFCESKEEVIAAAHRIGYPIVIKIVSSQIIHKSDAGGVKLNIESDESAITAYREIIEAAHSYNPGTKVEGVLVSPYVKDGVELIIGGVRDIQFGPVIMVGLGGIFVEIFRDIRFGIVPITESESEEMLAGLKAYPIIQGIRGSKRLDIESIKKTMMKTSELLEKEPVEELDLNPVFCFPDGVLVGDARISLMAGRSGNEHE